MCGIAGYICDKSYDKRIDIALPLMALYTQERGTDSWGWTNGSDIKKAVGWIEDGLTTEHYGHLQTAIHTRHATTGKKISENSHPFRIGNIVGMHNGMIYNHDELKKKYQRHVAVDSMHIFHHLFNDQSLSELEGYGTVVFWEDGVLHLGCFQDGDLEIAQTTFGMVFASTKRAIQCSFAMAGMKDAILGWYKPVDGELYKWVDGQLLLTERKLDISKGTSLAKWETFATSIAAGQGTAALLGTPETGFPLYDNRYLGSVMDDTEQKDTSLTDFAKCVACDKFIDADTWDTPVGAMCDDCEDEYYAVNDEGYEEDDTSYRCVTDDGYIIAIKTTAAALAPISQSVTCDDCLKDVLGEDVAYHVKMESYKYAVCEPCYQHNLAPTIETQSEVTEVTIH